MNLILIIEISYIQNIVLKEGLMQKSQELEYTYLDEETDYENEVEGLAVQTIELFATLSLKSQLKDVLKNGMTILINSLFQYMLQTK